MIRLDPLRSFRFLVEIEGITSGGFTRVKGLSREVKYESYREGGVIEYEHKLITQVSYPVVILERGLVVHEADSAVLKADRATLETYLGVTDASPRRGQPRL